METGACNAEVGGAMEWVAFGGEAAGTKQASVMGVHRIWAAR